MAGMDLGTARIKVTADTQEAQNNLNKLKSTGESLSGVGTALMPLTGAIAGVGLASIKASADAGEMQSKFKVVFGNLSKEAESWANSYADSIGRSKYEIQEAIANQADLFTGMGFGKQEALDLSKNITTLSYDLASFNNVTDSRALEAMTKAMMGETESAKMLGVNLTETVMKTSEFTKATGKSWNELSMAEKAQVRYQEAMKQSKNAIGDAERTSMSFTNQMKAMKGNLHEMAVAIGNTIVPLLEPLVIKFNEMLQGVVKLAEENPKLVGTLVAVAGALAVIPPILFLVGKAMALFAGLSSGAILAIAGVAGALAVLATAFLPIQEIMPIVVENFGNFMNNLVTKIVEKLPEFTQKAIEIINALIVGFVTNFPILLQGFITMIGQLAQAIWTLLPQFLSSAGQIIMALFNGLVTNAPILVGKIADIMVQLITKIAQNLPQFLQKGIELVTRIISGIGQKMPSLVSKVFQMVGKCITEIGKRLPEFMKKGMEIVLKIIDGLWKNKGKILKAVGDLIKGAIKSAFEAIKGFLNIGKAIVDNIKRGIAGAWSGLTGWISNKISKIPVVGSFFTGASAGKQEKKNTATKTPATFTTGAFMETGANSLFPTGFLDSASLFGATTRKSMAGYSRQKTRSNPEVDRLMNKIDDLLDQTREYSIEVPLVVEGRQIAKASARYIEQELNTMKSRSNRLAGVMSY